MASPSQTSTANTQRRRNSALWWGAIVTLLGVLSNFLYFVTAVGPIFPWLTLLISAAGLVLLFVGLKRAFGQPQVFRGKVVGSILGVVSLLLFALAVFGHFNARALPGSSHAPQVGQKAPDFTLTNTSGQTVSLSQLLSTPMDAASGKAPKAVLLVFYRGYW